MDTNDQIAFRHQDGSVHDLILDERVYPDRTCGQWEAGWWAFSPGDEEDQDAPGFFVAETGEVWEQPDNECVGKVMQA